MQCIKCPNSADTDLKHLGSLCNKCFLRTIEKRIRKDLTINKVFSPNDNILILNDNSLKAELTEYFLKSISKDIPLNIDIKEKITGKYDKIVAPKNLDDEIESFLEAMFNKTEYKKSKEIHLLKTVSNEELLILKKILKLKGNITKSKLGNTLDGLEKRYPGSKFGLLKSF
jgi:hypothetical protein